MYVLFDIGGTNTRVATTEDLETIKDIEKFKTPLSYREGISILRTTFDALRKGKKVRGIAGGIRGPLNHEKTGIVSETKLRDWVGRAIVRDIQTAMDAPVHLENDTALVGLGEVHFGAGKGYDIVAYHTVSTGVGGARFVHGVLDAASIGFEPGHQILDVDRTVLGYNVPPTLQSLISGDALEKRRGKKPFDIPQDDHVWDELALYFAHGLKNTIVYWSPDIIILGGSMIVGNPRIRLESIVSHTRSVLGNLLPCPPIVDAALKDEGGIYGAMALMKQKLSNKS